jgi:FeS assembly SUF system protein
MEEKIQDEIKRENSAPAPGAEATAAECADNNEVAKVEAASEEELRVTEQTIEMLRTVFDPEIPVNVYDLGLIYKIDYELPERTLHVDMTLTAPGCPAADFIMEDVRQKLMSVDGPKKVDLRLVFEPVWTQDMMSEEAKLELGFL